MLFGIILIKSELNYYFSLYSTTPNRYELVFLYTNPDDGIFNFWWSSFSSLQNEENIVVDAVISLIKKFVTNIFDALSFMQ